MVNYTMDMSNRSRVQKHYLIKRLISRCAESCIRCLVLVVLRGPSLIYHGGNRLVLKSCAGLFGFGTATTASGLRELGSKETRREERT